MSPSPSESNRDFAGKPDGIFLQGFHWNSHRHPWYQILRQQASAIQQAGFDYVWFPPPTASADPHGYLPTEWYNLNSQYGTEEDLVEAIASLRPAEVIADIVVNHRCGLHDWADFHNPHFAPEGTSDPAQIAEANRKAVVSEDEWQHSRGNADTGEQFDGGRDLDHRNPHVQQAIIQWLRWLKQEIGFAGWRWDYARGFDGAFVGLYNEASQPSISIGEYTESEPQTLLDWVERSGRRIDDKGRRPGRSCAFDVATRGLLKRAVEENNFSMLKTVHGKPSGLIGLLPRLAITYLDNHDTEADNQNDPFSYEHVLMGYAYLMTHPGSPCVFWPHFFDWEEPFGRTLGQLIRIRKQAGLHAESRVNILNAEQDLYAAVIDDKVAVKIGPGAWSPAEEGWTSASDGHDFAIWRR